MRDALLRQLATPVSRLQPVDAAAALLVHENGRYIVQLRDAKVDIFYPGHWGCFGGAVEKGEAPEQALRRELKEELEFEMQEGRRFTRFDFDFDALGFPKVYRIYYEVPVSAKAFDRFVLHEGADFKAFEARELLGQENVTPYDAFAIWMHASRLQFKGE